MVRRFLMIPILEIQEMAVMETADPIERSLAMLAGRRLVR